MKYLIMGVLASLCLTSCAHKYVRDNLDTWNEKPNESLLLTIKKASKGRKVAESLLVLRNNYPFTIVVPENSVRFEVNGHNALSASNPRWVLKHGDAVLEKIEFKFSDSESDGPAKIIVEYIYEGEDSTAVSTTTQGEGHTGGGAIVLRGVAVGGATSNSTSKTQSALIKSAIEGRRLPAIEVSLPDKKSEGWFFGLF